MRRLVFFFAFLSAPVLAQETRGNIAGTVKDSTGVIPGATVIIVNTDTGAKQELGTGTDETVHCIDMTARLGFDQICGDRERIEGMVI